MVIGWRQNGQAMEVLDGGYGMKTSFLILDCGFLIAIWSRGLSRVLQARDFRLRHAARRCADTGKPRLQE
jgi:hypothetical protein